MKHFSLAAVLLLAGAPAWAAPVRVQVLGPDKKPVPGAQIRVRFWNEADEIRRLLDGGKPAEPTRAQSDADGNARFEAPDAKAAGRGMMGGMVGAVMVWAPDLSLVMGTLKEGDNTLSLAPAGTARGVVVDGAGRPVEGALVGLRGVTPPGGGDRFSGAYPLGEAGLSEPAFQARTDARGRWSLKGLPLGGKAGVDLADEKFAMTMALAPVAQDAAEPAWDSIERAARALATAPASTSTASRGPGARFNEDGALVARPASTITGRVLDAAGAPIAGASVAASSPHNPYAFAFNSGRSNEAGDFRIERLNAGDYEVTVTRAPRAKDAARAAAQGVPGEPVKVTLAEGASAVAGELKLIPGAQIALRMVDAETGRGIAGLSAYARRTDRETRQFLASEPTDEQGRTTLHVAPGVHQAILMQPLDDYLSPENSSYNDSPRHTLAAGGVANVEWKLKKGLVGAGRVVDEAGKPIPNIAVTFRDAKRDGWDGRGMITSDGAGRWKSGRFEAGAYKISVQQSGEWRVARPKDVSFPHNGPLDIVLSPVPHVAVAGRVVDAAGTPLAGAAVALKISVVEDNFGTEVERTALTGADGAWRVETIPENARSISVAASLAGYGVARAAQASQDKEKKWAVTDAQLVKRDARLAGRVLDEAGAPVAGAQVLAGSTQAVAASGAGGEWSFGDLPSGEVEVVAVSGAKSAVATTLAPNEAVSLKLKAAEVSAPGDAEGARAVAEEAWQASRGSQFYDRTSLPAVLAAADADAALLMARGEAKSAPPGATLAIVRALAQKAGGAEDAAAWAEGNWEAVEADLTERANVVLAVAEALEKDGSEGARAEAKKWLARARTVYATLTDDGSRPQIAPRLAALAWRLKEADAQALFEASLKLATQKTNGMNDFDSLAWAVAGARADWAGKVIEAAIAAAPTQPQYSNGPDSTAGWAIQRLARVDLAGAKALLKQHGGLKSRYGVSWELNRARAAVLAERARAGEDVDALVREAGELEGQMKVRALGLIAEAGPPARRVELLKKALESSSPFTQYSLDDVLPIVRRLIPLDRDAARKALEDLRLILEAPRDERMGAQRVRGDVAGWAWLMRGFDVGAARWMIEREWAIGMALPPSDQDEWNRWSQMGLLAQAMAPLDTERALQMAGRLPISGHNAPSFPAQRGIARWMIASEEDRASRPFAFWGRSSYDEERHLNDW